MTELPDQVINALQKTPGFNAGQFKEAHLSPPVVSVRLNPFKPTPATGQLPVQGLVPWCNEGRYLSERPSFTLDPVFHGGAYYVQEASSMFLDHVVRSLFNATSPPKRVLDLCAAPGGKSTLLASALPQSFIVSNEVIKTRVGILTENISKWGRSHVVVTNNDPAQFKGLPGFFDLMVVDAPCSGSGLFRKDAGAINEWSPENVMLCSLRQKRILADSIGSLKKNGYLVYSTCSLSMEEDEDICDWIVENYRLTPVAVPVPETWGVTATLSPGCGAPGYRFYPGKVQGEGFFLACFRQENEVEEYFSYPAKVFYPPRHVVEVVQPMINNSQLYTFRTYHETLVAILKQWEEDIDAITAVLNVKKQGVALGMVKGKDFIPHHELALYGLQSEHTPVVQLTKGDALSYLRRHDIHVQVSQKGWMICRYEDINLGWIKVLPNRVNNYYPTNLRILKL